MPEYYFLGAPGINTEDEEEMTGRQKFTQKTPAASQRQGRNVIIKRPQGSRREEAMAFLSDKRADVETLRCLTKMDSPIVSEVRS